jgi:hypothetical protein
MFLHFVPVVGSSTFQEFWGGKGTFFYVFMFFENKPVDTLLEVSKRPQINPINIKVGNA